MAVIGILVFIAIFAIVAPVLLLWGGAGEAGKKKKTLAVLDSAIGTASGLNDPHVNFRRVEIVSAIPWLNKSLERFDILPKLRTMLLQAEVKWTPTALILMSLTSFAVAAYLVNLRTGSALLSLVIGAALGAIPFGYVAFKRAKRFSKFEQVLPEALDLIVSALRVGHGFNSAMGLVSRECPEPVASEFRTAFDEQNFGLDLRVALDNLVTRIPLQDLRMTVTAILIQRESGGNLAEVLEKTSYVIRQRFRLKKQVMVHTAQGRLTGWILTILPIALGIGLYMVNPDTMSLLWKRDIGIKLMWCAAGMLVLGSVIIQKIVRMDV